MAGIERHQANIGHSVAFCFLLGGGVKNESRCDCRTQRNKPGKGDSAKFGFHSDPLLFLLLLHYFLQRRRNAAARLA
jgi:hypothetical protein